MKNLTLSLGFLLILLGLAAYFGTGQESITALIPSFFGLTFVILGYLSTIKNVEKHVFRIATGVALFGAIGSYRGIPGFLDVLQGVEVARPVAVIAQAAMFLMCMVFILKAVFSFVQDRKS